MTKALKRNITVERFHSVETQADIYAHCGTTELSLRDVLRELQGVLGEVLLIELHEVTVGEGDSYLPVGKSESIRITCKKLGIACVPLDEILNPNFGMNCCAACPYHSNSMPMALVVAAILKLTFCSESSTNSSIAKDSQKKNY